MQTALKINLQKLAGKTTHVSEDLDSWAGRRTALCLASFVGVGAQPKQIGMPQASLKAVGNCRTFCTPASLLQITPSLGAVPLMAGGELGTSEPSPSCKMGAKRGWLVVDDGAEHVSVDTGGLVWGV